MSRAGSVEPERLAFIYKDGDRPPPGDRRTHLMQPPGQASYPGPLQTFPTVLHAGETMGNAKQNASPCQSHHEDKDRQMDRPSR